MSKNIEVELRSFITKEQYDRLVEFFKAQCKMFSSDDQMTYYFDAPIDIRLQQNNTFSKIWMKKGKMNSPQREEHEVHFDKEDFEKLEKMFLLLGHDVNVKWFRKRHHFLWKGFEVCVDDNKGFGYILEIEKKTDSAGKEWALLEIKKLFADLQIEVTPQKIQNEKYEYYVKNWKELTK